MLPFLLVLFIVQGSCTKCQRDEMIEASKYIKLSSGSDIDTTGIPYGESRTYACKQGATTMAWSNNVRKTSGVALDKIDEYSSVSRAQRGEVTVLCHAELGFIPNIFGYDVATWCVPGCNKVPEDFVSYWAVDYPVTLVTRDIKKAPIAIEIDYAVTLKCRAGYAQATADQGVTEVYCTNTGWAPSMLYWPACVPGCPDITKAVANGKTLAAPSTTAGKPPFTTGAIVEYTCNQGYTMLGHEALLCTSGQMWNRSPPQCIANTGSTSSALTMAFSRTALVLLCTALYCQMYADDVLFWDRLILSVL